MGDLTREKGYCEQMLGMLEDYTPLHGSGKKYGTLNALLSERNQSPNLESKVLYDRSTGAIAEHRLVYHSELPNATAYDTVGEAMGYGCSADNTLVGDKTEYELTFSESINAKEEWASTPEQVKKFCNADYNGWRTEHMMRKLRVARRKLNQQAYQKLKDGAGGIYVGQNADVSIDANADGILDTSPFTFTEMLGGDGQPRLNWMFDLDELFQLNEMTNGPLGVFSLGTLYRLLTAQNADAYCCNQDGISLANVAGMISKLGFAPFFDNTIQHAPVNATRDESIFFEPGSTYFHQRPLHVGVGSEFSSYYEEVNGVRLPIKVRTMFEDPEIPGLMWNYYIEHNSCGGTAAQKELGGVWNEGISCRANVWTKPTTVNSNYLAGTNQIMRLDFAQGSRLNSAGAAEVAPLG